MPEFQAVEPSKIKSWKPAVQVSGEADNWSYNGLRFATEKEALDNAKDLESRWMMVVGVAAHPSEDPVNYKWVGGKLEQVKTEVPA
jgi:hypothetical protein